MRTVPLAVHASQARGLVAALRSAGIGDDEAIEISVASETDLPEAVAEAVRVVHEIEAMALALDHRAQEVAARKGRLKERANRVRGAIVSALELAGLPNVPTPEGTVYLIAGRPAVRITDEAAIPAEFTSAKTSIAPDRGAIGRALAAGQRVPGAELSNGQTSLGIRR